MTGNPHRLTLERSDFVARFGPKADCIGGDSDCPRPRDSTDITHCDRCRFRIERTGPAMTDFTVPADASR